MESVVVVLQVRVVATQTYPKTTVTIRATGRTLVSIRREPPCLMRQRALLSVLLRVCLGVVDGSGDVVFGAAAAASVER
jgi:hypothetical protein